MIVYLQNPDIDRDKWDNCISASESFKPYAYSWYLDIMAPGWEALIDDDYDSVFPVPGFNKYGFHYVTTPIFLQQLGAFSPDKPVSEVVHEFIDYMPQFYKFVDLCVGQKVNYRGYKIFERANYELDLSASYEKICNNFSDHCRRNILAASKKKIDLTSEISSDELIDLFLKNKGTKIKGIKQRDYDRLKTLIDFCIRNKKGRIAGIRSKDHRLVYGVFLVEIKGSVTMLLVVNTPESRDSRMGYYLVNELIRDYAKTGTILDFAGSSIPSIAAFMESFGSTRVPFYRLYHNQLPWPVRMLK